jgi:hypothetical protein
MALGQSSGETLEVEVQADYLERVAKCRPSSAIAELIWNALDADATRVSVEFVRNVLGGLETLKIIDDGHGIGGEGEDPNALFCKLGGSWKKTRRTTASGRVLHGQAGEGRFRALALGDSVTWTTHRRERGELVASKISTTRGSRQFMKRSIKTTARSAGTVVTIERLKEIPAPDANGVYKTLCQEFALYLRNYPDVAIEFDRQTIDPQGIIARHDEIQIGIDVDNETTVMGDLVVIEWMTTMERALYLCDPNGFTLAEVPVGIQAPGFNFTAYVKLAYLRELKEQNLIDSDLAPGRERVISAAKRALREHFRTRLTENARSAVERWRNEDVYPYTSIAANPVESAERQVFDICAVNLAEYLPSFETSDLKQKRLTFRLLRQAIEANPDSLQTILGEVLGLPKEQQDDLADLLRQTSLSAIINASKIVADRLNFITGLENLIFDAESKQRFRERKQLHRMLAPNCWLFGEEFNLTVDDESLESVLQKHRALLGDDDANNGDDEVPVLREDGTRGVVDLMLSRSVPQPNALVREYLVVELKRPSKKIDEKVLGQLRSYAFAVADDERFRDTGTRWRFIAISNEISRSVERQANQRNRPRGLIHEDADNPVTVWVHTWSQLFHQARARLEFFRKELDYNANQATAKAHLQKVYAKYIPSENKSSLDPEDSEGNRRK